MFGVGVGGFGPAVAQVDGRGSFPLVAEPADVVQLGDVVPIRGEQVERPTRADRGQLGPVPHQQHLRPRIPGLLGQGVELERAGHGRLVHDHQLPGAKRPPLHLGSDRSGPVEKRAGTQRRTGLVQLGSQRVELRKALRLAGSFGEPLGCVLRGDTHHIGEYLRRSGGRGKADDRTGPVLTLPGFADPAHRCALTGPCGTDQHVDNPP